jgi:hypothetical protein
MTRTHELPVCHDGVVERQERIPHDRCAANLGEGPEHEHIKLTGIADEHDVVLVRPQISPHQRHIGGQPAGEQTELPPTALDAALVLHAAPDVGVHFGNRNIGPVRERRQQNSGPRLAEVVGSPDKYVHAALLGTHGLPRPAGHESKADGAKAAQVGVGRDFSQGRCRVEKVDPDQAARSAELNSVTRFLARMIGGIG